MVFQHQSNMSSGLFWSGPELCLYIVEEPLLQIDLGEHASF